MEKRLDILIEKLNAQKEDSDRIREAFEFACVAHEGQKRKDGSPYITHPLAAAEIIAEMGLDIDSAISAILHDTLEDTEASYEEIKKRFGQTVADLVDGVTKLTRVQYTSKEDEQMENLRKMFLAMAKDIRVILIKIADRLHNMRTIEYQDEKKRREKAHETMEIYAPLAHRLGMQRIKCELEDLALEYLDPIGFKEITDELAELQESNNNFLDHTIDRVGKGLVEYKISATIDGRIKHVYSIYRKMFNQDKAIYEIYDLYAVRVIVDDLVDCYNVLGIVHDIYKPMPGRFKDYISTPKPNMYQSLHTTVIGREGVPFEIQIRTREMHRVAEYGIAAHWKYKQGIDKEDNLEKRLQWVRQLLEAQEDTDADEFIRTLKIDMFDDEVFVFTPKGDVLNFPAGATPIDFAYAIHSEVGNRMTGAKVNGRIAGYDYHLQNGDIIEVLTSKQTHGPSRDWLDIAKTSEARNKIRQWFKKEKREENIAQGGQMFDTALKKLGVQLSDVLQDDVLPHYLKRMSFGSLDELYAAIGYGGVTSLRAANRARDELIRLNKLKDDKDIEPQLIISKRPKRTESGVIVEGIDNCLVKFSKCCSPVPGDDIVGFVTKGYGVSIHRTDCRNVRALEKANDMRRWIDVYWAEEPNEKYETGLVLMAMDRADLVVDIMTVLSTIKVPVTGLNARRFKNGSDAINISVEIKDLEQLRDVIKRLKSVRGVEQITRKSFDG